MPWVSFDFLRYARTTFCDVCTLASVMASPWTLRGPRRAKCTVVLFVLPASNPTNNPSIHAGAGMLPASAASAQGQVKSPVLVLSPVGHSVRLLARGQRAPPGAGGRRPRARADARRPRNLLQASPRDFPPSARFHLRIRRQASHVKHAQARCEKEGRHTGRGSVTAGGLRCSAPLTMGTLCLKPRHPMDFCDDVLTNRSRSPPTMLTALVCCSSLYVLPHNTYLVS
jgi:hypothetical protein